MDKCTVQGKSTTLNFLTLQKPEISTSSMGHYRIYSWQFLNTDKYCTVYLTSYNTVLWILYFSHADLVNLFSQANYAYNIDSCN